MTGRQSAGLFLPTAIVRRLLSRKVLILAVLVWSFNLASCRISHQEAVVDREGVFKTASSVPVIFSQTQCPNQHCENFFITVKSKIYYKHTSRKAKHSIFKKTLTVSQRLLLNKMLSDLTAVTGSFDIVPGSKTCHVYASDFPSYRLSWGSGGNRQTLSVYAGCEAIPAEVVSLIDWFLEKAGDRLPVSEI